jgi:hypothetical protein
MQRLNCNDIPEEELLKATDDSFIRGFLLSK